MASQLDSYAYISCTFGKEQKDWYWLYLCMIWIVAMAAYALIWILNSEFNFSEQRVVSKRQHLRCFSSKDSMPTYPVTTIVIILLSNALWLILAFVKYKYNNWRVMSKMFWCMPFVHALSGHILARIVHFYVWRGKSIWYSPLTFLGEETFSNMD